MKSLVEDMFVRNRLDNRPAKVMKEGKLITLQLLGLNNIQIRIKPSTFEKEWKVA